MKSWLTVWGVVLLLAFAGSANLHAQQLSRRLILRDGSFQSVSKYEVKGERVKYLSAERGEWEELPSTLVDWDATNKFNEGRAKAEPSPEAMELDKEAEAERKEEEARAPVVAQGLSLPPDGGVFLFDNFQGQGQLVELQQSSGEINRNTAANILRGAINPIASAKENVELKGQHAAIQAHILRPVIYLQENPGDATVKPQSQRSEPQQPEQPQKPIQAFGEHYALVRADIKKDARVVGNIKVAVYGKVSQQQKLVRTKTEPVSGGWIKLVPVADLAPGEYAVVELLGKEGMNLFVWDFGVNPKAVANPTAWKPVLPKAAAPPAKAPELEKRN